MAFINGRPNSLECKVVYWGPGLSGRSSNLDHIRRALVPVGQSQGPGLSLEIGEHRGLKVRVRLSTGPGAVVDEAASRLLLKGVDGVVFVADSQDERVEANMVALEQLEALLADHGLAIDRIPLVFQYNKRDLPGVVAVADLEVVLNPWQRLAYEAVATTGDGVLETFREIASQVFRELRRP